ncbi:MAG: hypothetical protein KAQ83_03045 [Nanoarchaeota archaeon]|nr:hypothetical protein [Nanoarchaeota archaeon]
MLKLPESMKECLYFTRRALGEKGKAMAWVYKKECPKCKKAVMGKPLNEKTGRPKIRATEYICPECGYSEEKVEHEESLSMQIKYICEFCEFEGEAEVPFKRKTFKGVKSVVFECGKCNEKMAITKKMKEVKKKKK